MIFFCYFFSLIVGVSFFVCFFLRLSEEIKKLIFSRLASFPSSCFLIIIINAEIIYIINRKLIMSTNQLLSVSILLRVSVFLLLFKSSGAIFNGRPASFNQFPSHVVLFMNEKSGRSDFCGGTLLSPTIVLTAAHCLFEDGKARFNR